MSHNKPWKIQVSLTVELPCSQPFWGDMIARAGAGPRPIPHRQLKAENLAEAIRYCLSPKAVTSARGIAAKMESEQGVRAAANSWFKQLPLERMRCDLVPSQPAVWTYNKSKKPMKLSKAAAAVLLAHDTVQLKQLSMLVFFLTNIARADELADMMRRAGTRVIPSPSTQHAGILSPEAHPLSWLQQLI